MDFKIKRNDLLQGLQTIQSIVDRKSTMPILSNALFQLSQSGLRISATDLEVGMIVEIPVQCNLEGKAALPAKSLYEIAKELGGEEIIFRAKTSGWVELGCGKSQFKIVQLPAEEFPSMPVIDVSKLVKVSGEDLVYLIEKTSYAVSLDETKYNLNGVYLERVDKESLRMVATDGHRLSHVERKVALGLEKGVIIPRKGVMEMKRLLASGGEYLFGVEGRNVVLKTDQALLIVRLIEGDFPDYQKVIPKDLEKVVSVGRNEILGALRRVSLLSQDKNRGVKMIFSSGNLEIQSSNPDIGEAREELEVDYKGERVEVGFNPRYFLDTIHALSDEKIILEFKDEISPCVMRSEYDRSFINVIMPMRL
ncbi:MAG: DNA polymerase III subunit beta [Deltaproteobacteria bacterium]|nr:DNA polymerase III subunit beta [Deltaproteobacteria bacterium]